MSLSPQVDIPALFKALGAASEEDRARPALSFYKGKTRVERVSYADLLARTAVVASHLKASLGIARGDRLAIVSPNRMEVPILVLAAMRLGATVVPLNPAAPAEDWEYILHHSGARALFATAELRQRLPPELRAGTFARGIEDLGGVRGEVGVLGDLGTLARETAVILYTSGTTGTPKGVALSQSSLLANAWSMAENFGLRGDPQLAVLPLYHAHAFGFGLMTALTTWGHLVFTDGLDPFAWSDVIREEQVTVTSVVPTLLALLLKTRAKQERVPSLRSILVSSAPLTVDLARRFEAESGIPLVLGWGLSEYTNFACCMSPHGDPAERRALLIEGDVPSIGSPLEGTEVVVRDAEGTTLGPDARGELWIRGHSTMLSYYRDPETTARAVDAGGWLRTGDEGFFTNRGGNRLFFITGRLKELIIRGGEKLSPIAIEQRILGAIPELQGQLAILGFAHESLGEEIGAYLELASLSRELRVKLDGVLSALPADQAPKVVVYGAPHIPRTHTGKVQRMKLRPVFSSFSACRGPALFVDAADLDT
ncbi:MAG: class I adenylate-forming enzyme family protein [Polyangiaceae bacterium]